MMRFYESTSMRLIVDAIKSVLDPRGYDVIRADDRDYSGELWSNVELCINGSELGIAVFEDIDQRHYDSNIGVELGYMLALKRQCLLLKEQRSSNLPVVIGHRLYKSFDMLDINTTVRRAVAEWVDRDVEGKQAISRS